MAKRDGLIVVARGDGWLLAWPRERWEGLTAEQQQDVIDVQTALVSQNVPPNGTRRRVRARTLPDGDMVAHIPTVAGQGTDEGVTHARPR